MSALIPFKDPRQFDQGRARDPLEVPCVPTDEVTPFKYRRVITGHSRDGIARVLVDDNNANARITGEGNGAATVWTTSGMPADIRNPETLGDAGAGHIGTPPPVNGTRFSLTEMPPGAIGNKHRTETVDYVLVLSGSVDMELDETTVTLRAGDVVVQRGTNHRWINRGIVPARLAFVFIDAVPLGVGNPVPRGGAGSAKA
jgi:quercetin dioxygenase-like cupin family protein